MSKFIGTNQQLINCLQIIADSRSSSQRDTAILVEAADRLRDATKELPALIAERDALRRIVELADVIVAGVNEVKADRYPPLFAAMRAYPVARAALGASHDAK